MNNLTIADILKCAKGKLIVGNTDVECENFSKDTRTIQNGDVYIGIKGEIFDGNAFWKDALDKGAQTVIVQGINFEEQDVTCYTNKNIIQVEDTLNALYEIAKMKRRMYNIPVVAITGSVGKTSTKDVIASVLSKKYNTLKTEGNYNNNIGVPFTILKLKQHEALVIEMGMNHLGEISLLTSIAQPTISVITNVGTSHIGNLGSRENILKAKLEILEGMETPTVVINNDNDMLHNWYEENKAKINIYPYGLENESKVKVKDIQYSFDNTKITTILNKDIVVINIPVGGKHFVNNILCAIIVGEMLNLSKNQIIQGVEDFKLTEKRMDMLQLKNDIIVINDTYNASYESMKAGIEYLAQNAKQRKIVVLGDMLELGEFSQKIHEDVGRVVKENSIDMLFCLGNDAKYIIQSAVDSGMDKKNVFFFEDKAELVNILRNMLQQGDTVLVKASNGMKFYEIVEMLKENI